MLGCLALALGCAAPAHGAGLGTLTTFPVTPGLTPNSIASGPDDAMWFTTLFSDPIGRIAPDGTITMFAGPTGTQPNALVTGADGNLWFTEAAGTAIGRITPDGTITEYPLPTPYATGPIALGADGNVWFGGPGLIGRITPAGTITEYPIPGVSNAVTNLAAGTDDSLWFTVIDRNIVGRITLAGNISLFTPPTTNPGADGARPNGLAIQPDGSVWYGSDQHSELARLRPDGVAIAGSAVPATSTWLPGLALGPDGAIWWTSELTGDIGRIAPDGRTVTTYRKPTGSPRTWSVAAGADGNMWVTDDGSFTIQRIGTGRPAALLTPPLITGTLREGDQVQCGGERWSTWAGEQPRDTGITWRRDGTPIAGATARTYSATASDVGTQLTCNIRVRYDLVGVWANATSAPAVISAANQPASTTPPGGSTTPPAPAPERPATPSSPTATPRHLAWCAQQVATRWRCTKRALVGKAARIPLGTVIMRKAVLTNTRNGKTYAVKVRRQADGAVMISRQSAQPIPRGHYLLRSWKGTTSVVVS